MRDGLYKVSKVMYTLSACDVPNGLMFDPYGDLARGASKRAMVDAATNKAEAAYDGLLCKNPADFLPFGGAVAADVAAVNQAVQCGSGGTPAAVAPTGDPIAAAALASLGVSAGGTASQGGATGPAPGSIYRRGGARSRYADSGDASCADVGAATVVPLNGPGGAGLPAVSAAPAKLTSVGLPRGMGRYSTRKGMGDCCGGMPWGDAFPGGVPSSSASFLAGFWAWVSANPWLAGAGLAVALYAFSESNAGRRARG